MGIFNVRIEVGDLDGRRFETVDAMVDSGAAYSFMPTSMLRRLDIRPHRKMTFVMADGSRIERDFGWTRVKIGGEIEMSPVVFADDDTTPLLGAVTLELFGMGVDPVNGRLISVPAMPGAHALVGTPIHKL